MKKISAADVKKQEQEWQAEADLRTLIEAEKIAKDGPRHKRALAKRDAMLADLERI